MNTLLKLKFNIAYLLITTFIYSNFSFSQGGANCASATPFCSNSAYTFPNVTNTAANSTGENYGCLNDPNLAGIQNPSWHYLNISQGGTLNIQVSQQAANGAVLDLDFALWGPYSSPSAGCANISTGVPPIQCSSDPSNTETIGLGVQGGGNYWSTQYSNSINGQSTPPAAQAGEYYIVVVTNASNSSGNITFNQVGGTGSTNCNIVTNPSCSISNLTATATCNGGNSTIAGTLDVSGAPSTGTLTVSSSCGGSQVINAPFATTSGTLNYTFNGGAADGSTCTITATFSADPTCTATTSVTKATCGCSLTVTPTSTTICSGDNTTITPSATGGTWTTSDATIATVNNGVVTGVANGVVTITYSDGTCSATAQITVKNSVTATFTNPGPICSGQSLTLPVASNEGVTGTWSPAVDNTQTTTYTFTPDAGQCSAPVTMKVDVNSTVTPLFANPGPICSNEKFTLPTTSTNGIVGAWTPTVDFTQTTTYFFVPTNNTCATSTSMTVVVNTNNSTTSVTATDKVVTEGNTTNLNVTLTPYIPGILYSWNPSNTLSCSDCPNPVATPNKAGWYYVTMTTPEGCKIKDSIYIDYRIICGEVFAPNVFSPNGDGNNDLFKVRGRCVVGIQLSVYDRWGNRVFYTEDSSEGWDGTYKGKELNTGVYYYTMTVSLLYGKKEDYKGSISLTR